MKPNLLVITNGFPDVRNKRYNCQFVYEYTNAVKEQFNNIYVISPQPYFPKILSRFSRLIAFSKLANFEDYSIDNIKVYYPKYLTLPFKFLRDLNYLPFSHQIRKVIKKENLMFDLVHTHFLNVSGQAVFKLKRELDKPSILSTHGGDVYEWPFQKPTNLKIAKMVLGKFDQITAPSLYLSDSLRQINSYLKTKISITPNFIDPNIFKRLPKKHCRKKLGLPLDKIIILNVANLISKKGQIDLIMAVKDMPDTLTVLIGEGENRTEIESLISSLNLKDKVVLIGSVNNSLLPLWYNAADLFVFPSYQESFGIVQIESLACGTPVVAYNNEGSKTIITKKLGKLCPVGNIKALKNNINNALQQKWNPVNISHTVHNQYSQHVFQQNLIIIYDRLLNKDKPFISSKLNKLKGRTKAKYA